MKGIDTMTKKMTKKDYFEILKGAYPKNANNYNEVIEFINHEIELLENKKAGVRKPTATQVENENLKAEIVNFLQNGEKFTITDLQKSIASLENLSNQRVSAIMKQLTDSGVVMKEYEKRKAYFFMGD